MVVLICVKLQCCNGHYTDICNGKLIGTVLNCWKVKYFWRQNTQEDPIRIRIPQEAELRFRWKCPDPTISGSAVLDCWKYLYTLHNIERLPYLFLSAGIWIVRITKPVFFIFQNRRKVTFEIFYLFGVMWLGLQINSTVKAKKIVELHVWDTEEIRNNWHGNHFHWMPH
jgi:hypothetical protein